MMQLERIDQRQTAHRKIGIGRIYLWYFNPLCAAGAILQKMRFL
ncbi:hypothetical protein NBRC111894_683 [Sporolactobacillus inulinus]|uniref:Uncharacterized protein n=1 Tax=Sporolactobacillus inulinus TaxID=2078 RepID=A0A4Y1Z7W9_9BACL|nr:hypothetical protein NBRC111894_683 [Sporolactobacillus inulinus]